MKFDMMKNDELAFDALPDRPQLRPLIPFANAVWQWPAVVALWIGGSMARGNSDRYSDVDVVVAVKDEALDRGMLLMAQTGIQNERGLLLRLWYVEATGLDCGDIRSQTIFGMTQVMRTVEKAKGAEGLDIMGASLIDYAAIVRAIEQLREEVAKVGRTLADLLVFPYPLELEAVVLQGWQEHAYTGY